MSKEIWVLVLKVLGMLGLRSEIWAFLSSIS